MPEKNVPLYEIDRAIRINCHIDHDAAKALTLVKDGIHKNQGIGRKLFIYVAIKAGFNKEEICDYLKISNLEFEKKVADLQEYYKKGRNAFLNRDHAIDESCLLFYRKLLLVGNYLRYRYDFKI